MSEATSTPTATAASATPIVDTRRSGIAIVDQAIEAVRAADGDAIAKLIHYVPMPCITAPQQVGSPPACRAGEADGTLVGVVSVLRCEGVYQREDELALGLDGAPFPPPGSALYAVYRSGPDTFPPSQYTVLFTQPELQRGFRGAFALKMSDDGVLGISHGCVGTIKEFLEYGHFGDAIVPP